MSKVSFWSYWAVLAVKTLITTIKSGCVSGFKFASTSETGQSFARTEIFVHVLPSELRRESWPCKTTLRNNCANTLTNTLCTYCTCANVHCKLQCIKLYLGGRFSHRIDDYLQILLWGIVPVKEQQQLPSMIIISRLRDKSSNTIWNAPSRIVHLLNITIDLGMPQVISMAVRPTKRKCHHCLFWMLGRDRRG